MNLVQEKQIESTCVWRVGLLGLSHESNTFEDGWTEYGDFAAPQDREQLLLNEQLLGLRDSASVWAGALPVLGHGDVELVPLYRAAAAPSATVSAKTWKRLFQEVVAMVSHAGPLDGLLVELHGAMVADHVDDCEGELLQRLRALLGPGCVIVATLDFHANVSARMVHACDQLLPYRTYPHIDMAETGARAARALLSRLQTPNPHPPLWRRMDYLVPLESQYTGSGPMASFLAGCAERSAALQADIVFCAGFPLADTPNTSPTLVAYPWPTADASTGSSLQRALDGLSAQFEALSTTFQRGAVHTSTLSEQLEDGASGLTVVADIADNPGAGFAGNDTTILKLLHHRDVMQSLVATLALPELARQAHAAGAGETFKASSGPLHGEPLRVLALSDGAYRCTGPMWFGRSIQQGPTARLDWDGIEFIVSSRKVQAMDPAALLCVGCRASDYRVLVLKSTVHFRAAFEPVASRVICVDTRMPDAHTPWIPSYRHLRAGTRPSPSHPPFVLGKERSHAQL